MINYVTNLDVNDHSGGWSGMNHFIYEKLASGFAVNLVQKINPAYSLSDRLMSKMFRTAGLAGNFPAFTQARLKQIAQLVDPKLHTSASFTFFHGATSWLSVRTNTPYAVYMDACFGTYMRIYHQAQKFSSNQLSAVCKQEASFISNSAAAFFSSAWALEDARKLYGIKTNNLHVAGLGGGIERSVEPEVSTEKYFLFVALDFVGKGGVEVVDAFTVLQKEHKDFKLKIVGQQPPPQYLQHVNIEYAGRLNKNIPVERKKLESLFTNAYCFVLPTTRDLTPLVLVEAGSVGCPVISTSSFGIPEIVIDQKTGLLISPGADMKHQLFTAMHRMCTDHNLHEKMKVNAAEHIRENFTWDRVGERIIEKISTTFQLQ